MFKVRATVFVGNRVLRRLGVFLCLMTGLYICQLSSIFFFSVLGCLPSSYSNRVCPSVSARFIMSAECPVYLIFFLELFSVFSCLSEFLSCLLVVCLSCMMHVFIGISQCLALFILCIRWLLQRKKTPSILRLIYCVYLSGYYVIIYVWVYWVNVKDKDVEHRQEWNYDHILVLRH